MTLQTPNVDPSPIAGLSFFDDFLGSTYDNEVWNLNGITVTPQNSNGGRLLFSGAATEFRMGNIGVFSAAHNAHIIWRGILTPGGNTSECGLDGAGDQGTEWIAWYADTGNFKCQCGSGGNTTTVDSGVAIDANTHLFEIIVSTGFSQFFIDGVFKTTITTNVTTSVVQPYIWLTGAGTANMDYVLVQGDR